MKEKEEINFAYFSNFIAFSHLDLGEILMKLNNSSVSPKDQDIYLTRCLWNHLKEIRVKKFAH
jgi:hypothetical protein